MGTDDIKHKAEEFKGSTKETVGDVTGNDELEAEGNADKNKAKAEGAIDEAKDKVAGAAELAKDKVNDALGRDHK